MRRFLLAMMLCVTCVPAHAQSDDERYNIIAPEPWLTPKYKTPRGSTEHVVNPPPAQAPRPHAVQPPPLVLPQTGQVTPNLPVLAPSGPNGTETYQDRAVRCAHQAGVYGQAAGDRNAYVGTCINQ